jgi:hypothetical protein
MTKYVFCVFTNAVEGREAEYNDWYTNTHLADVVAVPGFVAAQRFKVEAAGQHGPAHRYLAIYEVETDDLEATKAALMNAAKSGAMPVSDALDPNVSAWYFEEISERVTQGAATVV